MASGVKSSSIIMAVAAWSTSVMGADLWKMYETHASACKNVSAPKQPFVCYDCGIGNRSFAVLPLNEGMSAYLYRGDSVLAAEAISEVLAEPSAGCAWGGSAGCAAKEDQTCNEIQKMTMESGSTCMDTPGVTYQMCDSERYNEAKTRCSQQGNGRCMWWNDVHQGGHDGVCVSPDVALRMLLTSYADFSLQGVCDFACLQAAEPCANHDLAKAFGCQWKEAQTESCDMYGCVEGKPAKCFHDVLWDYEVDKITKENKRFVQGQFTDVAAVLGGVLGHPSVPGAALGSAFHPGNGCTSIDDEALCLGEDVSCGEVKEAYKTSKCCGASKDTQVVGLKKYGARRLQATSIKQSNPTKNDDAVEMLERELNDVQARLAAARRAQQNDL